jgi:2-pyrone-4,6-dicarboxylate lactonase
MRGGIGFERIDRYEAICAEMGWHLQILSTTRELERIASRLSKLTVPFVLDHMGGPAVKDGLDAPGWKLMLSLVADGAWTKSAGAYRLSSEPSYTDAIPFARSLIQTAPDRCVWGSDWPQVGFWGPMPNVGTLLDLLADWAPTPTPATRS